MTRRTRRPFSATCKAVATLLPFRLLAVTATVAVVLAIRKVLLTVPARQATDGQPGGTGVGKRTGTG